jgi:predicted  nucleic acid-binding Zn-ribbon protein
MNELLLLLWRDRAVFIAIVLLIGSLTVWAYSIVPRAYVASAWFVVNESPASLLQVGSGDRDRRDEFIRTQVRLAVSDEVVRRTAQAVGPARVLDEVQCRWASIFDQEWLPETIRAKLGRFGCKWDGLSLEDRAFLRISDLISAESEPNTDLFRILARSDDASFAAELASHASKSFLARYAEVYSSQVAESFYRSQEMLYQAELAEASGRLHAFMTKTRMYSIEDQRRILLERRDTEYATLNSTNGSIQRMDSEQASLQQQIRGLRGKLVLPPEIFGASVANASGATARNELSNAADPPLLHVKLFQDAAQQLVKSNAELAGLRALQAEQTRALNTFDEQLRTLADVEAEFRQLKQRVSQAEAQITIFKNKQAEAQVDSAWRSNERLSNVQIFQPASPPLEPTFPNKTVFSVFGLLTSFAAGLAVVILRWVARDLQPPRSTGLH